MPTNRNFWIVEITFYYVCYQDATPTRIFSSKITFFKDFILPLKIVVQTRGKFELERWGLLLLWHHVCLCASTLQPVRVHLSNGRGNLAGGGPHMGVIQDILLASAQLAHANKQGSLPALWRAWQKPQCSTVLRWNYNWIVAGSWTYLHAKIYIYAFYLKDLDFPCFFLLCLIHFL